MSTTMHTKDITMSGHAATLACDGNCRKAWGICARPRVTLGADDDDFAYLSDGELGDAPDDPGTYEGGHAKPASPAAMNKWCGRQCERSTLVSRGDSIKLPDFTVRLINQPWKHHRPATAPGQPANSPQP